MLAIITKNLAPYRNALYEEVAEQFKAQGKSLLITPSGKAPDHDWDNLLPSSPLLEVKEVPCQVFESRLLAKFYRSQETVIRVPTRTPEVGKVLDEAKPALLWCHEFSPYVSEGFRWAERMKRGIIVSTELGDRGRGRIPLPLRLLQNRKLKKADLIVAHTKDAYDSAMAMGIPAVFSPHSIRCDGASERKPDSVFRFLYVGNLIHRKGIDILLEAIEKLVQKNPSSEKGTWELVLVGGNSDQNYEEEVKNKGLEPRVVFKGFLEGQDLLDEYAAADCFVLPSRYDTYAVVVHEAAQAGLALIVSSDAGSSEVLVRENENGYRVKPEALDFAEAMAKVLSGALPEARKVSLEVAKAHSVEENAKKIVSRLDRMTAEAAPLDFVIIGAQKSASTFVHRALLDHPELFLPDGETNYFERTIFEEQTVEQFEANFENAKRGQLKGIKRPDYLALPECADRISHYSPQSKIVCVLRDPISRAVSAYYHYVAGGFLPALEVNEGLQKILAGELSDYPAAETILSYGKYGSSLQYWFEKFPKENIYVRLQEDFVEDSQGEMSLLYRFLGVEEQFVSANIKRRSQAVVYNMKRARNLGSIHRVLRNWHKDGLNHSSRFGFLGLLPWWGYLAVDRKILSRFMENEKPQLTDETRDSLRNFYRDDISLLEQLIDRKLSHWVE